ncbi:DNA-directed RNA polymerase subunit epsilon [Halobaculum sp. P14]|uniref:DNA-directed RNA polymerase subunit epsilon n=1 Tax=Halobaculum sp. P14 TaxID=3421638 RepID=UPI003EC005DB
MTDGDAAASANASATAADGAGVGWVDADDAGAAERRVDRRPGAGSLGRAEARRDTTLRRWDVVTPSATRIGRPRGGDADVSERVRRLHEERHPATEGHAERAHRLDRLRITQAICDTLDLTPWQRDRVLGVMDGLDLTAFGSQRAIEKVALVVVNHVVAEERRRYLGLHDDEYVAGLDADRMTELYDRYRELSMKSDETFRRLLDQYDMTTTNVNRLDNVLDEQLDDRGLRGAALGRNPNRDPNIPEVASDRHAAGGEGSSANAEPDARPDGGD